MFIPNKNMMKRAQSSINNKMTLLISGVVLVFLIAQLAPQMFTSLADGASTNVTVTNSTGGEVTVEDPIPSWVVSVLTVIIGAGVVFMIWRHFNK